MVDGATANIGLADLVHLDSAHHAAGNIVVLEGILQGERVHNGREHAHIIGLSTLHATGSACHAAENIAAADNDADLMANGEQLLDLLGKMVGNLGVDAILAVAHQCFAGKLKKHAFISDVGQSDPPLIRLSI